MRYILTILIALLLCACFPVQIAPEIRDYKITKGKKFKRSLPKRYTYVFEDYKNADEFYYYINTKFQRDDNYVEDNTQITIDNRSYYLSFYEVEKKTKIVNLIPILIERTISGSDAPSEEEIDVIREGTWYIVLTVQDVAFKDALSPSHREQQKVIDYLSKLKSEYFTTTDYYSAYLRNKLDSN